MDKKKKNKQSFEISMNPYVFTALLFFFGMWCFYDGWLTTNPDMQAHTLFNKVLSMLLLPWAVYDFFKVKKKYKLMNDKRESGSESREPDD